MPLLLFLASCITDADLRDRYDWDNDGFYVAEAGEDEVDCNDFDDTVYPGADDPPYDGVDSNCDGHSDYDADGDGFDSDAHGGDDCDDAEPGVHPSASEACDQVDNDCDGSVDEDGASGESSWYLDSDNDGYGDPKSGVESCSAPSGHVEDSTDCDDADSSIYPGGVEDCALGDGDCDGNDERCGVSSGTVDDGWAHFPDSGKVVASAGDVDGDGYDDWLIGLADFKAQRGVVRLFTGAPGLLSGTFDSTAASALLQGDENDEWFGDELAGGDLDGDGFSDIAVGSTYRTHVGSPGGVSLFYGSASGPVGDSPSTAGAYLEGAQAGDAAGAALAVVRGVLDSGEAYLVVGAPDANDSDGAVYFVSGASPPSGAVDLADATAVLSSYDSSRVGSALSGGSDVNGDGVGDLVVGASDSGGGGTDRGAVAVLLGGSGLSGSFLFGESELVVWDGATDNEQLGSGVADAGDFDGDGYADLAASAGGESSVYLIHGGAALAGRSDVETSAAVELIGEAGSNLGHSVASGADIDGDGRDDLACGARFALESAGAVYVFYGSTRTGVFDVSTADEMISGATKNARTGSSVALVEDGNGDGFPELLIGSETGTYLFYGGPGS